MQIEIVNVGTIETVPTAKGSYKSTEIAYKYLGKLQGKKIVDWKYPDAWKALVNSKSGDLIDITVGTDGAFKPWIEAYPAGTGTATGAVGQPEPSTAPAARTASSGRPTSSSTGRVTGSNYETPEERALRREADRVRQIYIVRQSSLTLAKDLLIHNAGKSTVDEAAISKMARFFEGHVFREDGLAEMKNDEV